MSKILFGLLLVLFLGCTNKVSLKPYPDPYQLAFKNKGIKNVLIHNSNDTKNLIDSLVLDDVGNIIYRNGYMHEEWAEYDSLGFVKRILQIADAPYNYKIKYLMKGHELVQTWIPIKHKEWNYEKSDLDFKSQFLVKFKLDDDGKIIYQEDERSGTITTYSYNRSNQLVNKLEKSMEGSSDLKYKWLYSYENDLLLETEMYSQDQKMMTHYYTNGLLDSTVHYKNGFDAVRKFQYQYY